jgi:hypothetical protein
MRYDIEVSDIKFGLELPDFPDETDASDTTDELAELFLSRFNGEKVYFGFLITVADAQEYCSRDDTHGSGWFVGWYRR